MIITYASIATYIVGLLAAWRPIAGHIAWSISTAYGQKRPDSGDWVIGSTMGLIWPVTISYYILKFIGSKFPGLPGRRVGAEAEAIRRNKEKKLKTLEQDLLDH